MILAGTANAEVLVLRQDVGHALAPPTKTYGHRPISRIVLQEEDGIAVVAGSSPGSAGLQAPTLIRFSEAQGQGNPCPACEYPSRVAMLVTDFAALIV